MGRSHETSNKKNVRTKKEKKRKDKEQKRIARRENSQKNSFDDMIAYVDENGMITDTEPDPKKKKKIKLEDIEIDVAKGNKNPDDNTTRNGVVTYFNESKGFGFIKDSVSKESIFVHNSNTLEAICENNMVSFEIGRGAKGLIALQVKLVR
jgi:cold shock CspA family protein